MARSSTFQASKTQPGRTRVAVDALLFLAAILTVAGVAFSTRPAANGQVAQVSAELRSR